MKQDAEKAVTLLESAIVRDPKFSLAYCSLADAHLNLVEVAHWDKARVEKAKQAIEAALRISPDSAEAHLRMARYFFRAADDVDAAEKELAIAATGLPGRADVYSLRVEIERRSARWKEALEDALKAAELEPRDSGTAAGLAELYILLRRYNEVQRLVDHMIAAAPEKETGLFWRWKCSIALAKGDLKAALAALDGSPSRNAGLFGFNHAKAYVLMLQRDYTRAEQLLQSSDLTAQRGTAVADDDNELHRRGLTLEKLGRIARFRGDKENARTYFESARDSFKRWLDDKPPNEPWRESHALAYIAECDAALGRKDEAIREAQSAIAYCQAKGNPWGAIADIQTLLAIIYMWSGERDAALQQLAEAAKLPAMPIALVPGAVGLSAGDLKLNPVWDELRDDSRFANIVAEAAKPIKLDQLRREMTKPAPSGADVGELRVDPRWDPLRNGARFQDLLTNYAGRPSLLTPARRFAEHAGGARILLKREDLNHTGSHKVNNVLGQVLLATYVSFGLAKWWDHECDITQPLTILSTSYYMAPD